MELVAKRTWIGAEGKVVRGQKFETTQDRADKLLAEGRAARPEDVATPKPKKKRGRPRKAAPDVELQDSAPDETQEAGPDEAV